MGIDFHSKENSYTYTTRHADSTWMQAIKQLLPYENISRALDIGCGGGIYSKALSEIGVGFVTGLDFSEAMLQGARENCKDYENIAFVRGSALDTGLDRCSYDLLLQRALIHHIQDLRVCFIEAYRILKAGGSYIIQDRTLEDCLLEGSETHIRGYFFDLFPKLTEKEAIRRHSSQHVIETLREVGFKEIEEIKLWEKRTIHDNKEQLLKDLSERTGRSILHELNSIELKRLLTYIDGAVSKDKNIVEKD